MDETIDLRPYVEGLVRRWRIILGAVIVSALLAVLLYFSQSDYQATALVAVTDPAQHLEFDARIVNTVNLDDLLQVYPEIAMSDSVLSSLLDEAQALTDGHINNLPQLASMLKAETGADMRLIRLIVHNSDPQLASSLANEWAKTFVAAVNSIYLSPGGEIEFYTDQLAQTENQLRAAEQSLVEFQSGSRIAIVENELLELSNLQMTYLAKKSRLNLALDDIRSLHAQIAAGTGETIPWSDQLVALMTQLKIYETQTANTVSQAPIQLQLNSQGDLTTSQRGDQLNLLNQIAIAAETSVGEIDVKLLGLESQIFSLQRDKEELLHTYEQLTRNRDVATETYLTLARKIDEVRIQSEDTTNGLRIASFAAQPLEPTRSNLIVMLIVSALVGFLLSVALLIVNSWWKSGTRPTN